jgi:hypothetical protein
MTDQQMINEPNIYRNILICPVAVSLVCTPTHNSTPIIKVSKIPMPCPTLRLSNCSTATPLATKTRKSIIHITS